MEISKSDSQGPNPSACDLGQGRRPQPAPFLHLCSEVEDQRPRLGPGAQRALAQRSPASVAPGPRAPASTSRLTSRGGAEAALLALGSGRGRRRGFARSPAAHPPRVAQFLTGHGPGLVHGPEVGTPALDKASRTEPRGNSPLSHSPAPWLTQSKENLTAPRKRAGFACTCSLRS